MRFSVLANDSDSQRVTWTTFAIPVFNDHILSNYSLWKMVPPEKGLRMACFCLVLSPRISIWRENIYITHSVSPFSTQFTTLEITIIFWDQRHYKSCPQKADIQWNNAKGTKLFRSARTSCRTFDVRPPVRPPARNNFSWVHRWAVTLPSGLRYPSNRIFSESWWCQLSKFGRKYKYKDKYRDKYKYRDK